MNFGGIALAVLSGACNGLFTAPMKLRSGFKWENTWLVFILVACIAMPVGIVGSSVPQWPRVFSQAPSAALTAALVFGFIWGFGAISWSDFRNLQHRIHACASDRTDGKIDGVAGVRGNELHLAADVRRRRHTEHRVLLLPHAQEQNRRTADRP